MKADANLNDVVLEDNRQMTGPEAGMRIKRLLKAKKVGERTEHSDMIQVQYSTDDLGQENRGHTCKFNPALREQSLAQILQPTNMGMHFSQDTDTNRTRIDINFNHLVFNVSPASIFIIYNSYNTFMESLAAQETEEEASSEVGASSQQGEAGQRLWETTTFNFDTTASNTGIHSGAAIRLNYLFNRPVLYLACRHHVFDLLAKNTFHKLVGYDPSPDVAMFKKMKDLWPDIDTQGTFMMFDLDNKAELVQLFTNILTKYNANGELFVREDYRELCELALVLIGGELPNGKVMRFKAPGAAHKARFMAFALCALKILAFSHLKEVKDKCFSRKVRKELIFEEQTLQNLWRWGHYAIQFYVPSFLLATLGRDAPSNDLNLFKSTIQYRNIDPEVADSALDTLARHKWYLVGQVIPFSLFSDNVTEDEKSRIAAKLLATEREESVSLGLPAYPVVTEQTELWDLVTPQTWQFFDIVKSDPVWLTQNVSEWDSHPDYRQVI